jgi:hypothetical protein
MNSFDSAEGSARKDHKSHVSNGRWLDLGRDARRTLPVALMELYPAANRFVHELVGVVAPEGRVAAQKDIGDDARGRVERKSV